MNGNTSGPDEKTHYLQNGIARTEKNMIALKTTLSGYVRNQERLRKKSMKLALVLKGFSEKEASGLRTLLGTLSDKLQEREKYREIMENRIILLSQEPLKLYSISCAKIQAEIKSRESALEKEQKKQMLLDKIVIKESNNRTKINQTQLELSGASHEVKTATQALIESVQRFESQKRKDLRVYTYI
ncbi:hypothetical protein HK096_010281 [Nowakowskiella sp. JEL0078]|nr:hypothetical protein HK096_010281 [Nowakowskiella sp. JEL0078]